jgi:predicted SAM-dependent methyltransferase
MLLGVRVGGPGQAFRDRFARGRRGGRAASNFLLTAVLSEEGDRKVNISRLLLGLGLHPLAKELYRIRKSIVQLGPLVAFAFRRGFGHVDRRIVRRYLSQTTERKLHIGCGENVLAGWLNTNLCPVSADILHLDATQPFPFSDKEFDYIYTEHVIEHVPYAQALRMVGECFRVLKPNGRIRLSTPDLAFLIDLHGEEKSDLQIRYVQWAVDTFIRRARPYRGAVEYTDAFVINNFFRDWGHEFIYDEKTLRALMESAGFSEVKRVGLNQSDHESFRNLANDRRMPAGHLHLETLTLEGIKAPVAQRRDTTVDAEAEAEALRVPAR